MPHRTVQIAGAVRINVGVTEPDGTTTKFNEPGPELSADEVGELLAATVDAAGRARWIVGCGSLAPRAPGPRKSDPP